MKKLNFLFTTALLVSTLSGCQQMQTIADTTVNTLSKGIQAYDGWISKGNARVWNEMQNTSIRNKLLVLSQENNSNSIKLNPILINDQYKL